MRSTTERKRDVLEAVETREEAVISTGAVADEAEMTPPTARKYLEELEEEGEVVEQVFGGNMHVWYTPDLKNRRTESVDGEPVEPEDSAADGHNEDEGGGEGESPVADGAGVDVDALLERVQMTQRRQQWADRGAVPLLLGVGAAVVNAWVTLPESALAVAGLLMLYGIVSLLFYGYLRVQGDASADADAAE